MIVTCKMFDRAVSDKKIPGDRPAEEKISAFEQAFQPLFIITAFS
jgi:hypothetical protein